MESLPLANQGSQHPTAQPASQCIVRLTPADAAAVSQLHRCAITTSFLSSLGCRFSKYLYKGLLSSPSAFGFACKEPDGRVLGYIACTQSTSKVYRQSLLRWGVMMALCLLPYVWRVSVLRRLWETFRYPAELPGELPCAEVLSIAVSLEAHGRGIGTRLMEVALGEFQRRGVSRVKVAVGAGNTAAIRFYQCCGFRLALTRMHHARPMNVYTIDLQG